MAGYLTVTDDRNLTTDGAAVVAKKFVRSQIPGAVGDGVTDDSAAVQAELTKAAKGGVLNLSGTYYMGSTPLSAVLSGPLSIQGNGTAKLVWDSGDGIKLTQNWATHTVTVDGVTLLTRAKGTGVALEIVSTGQNSTGANLRPRTRNRGSITRVNIGGNSVEANTGGDGSELTDGWGKGIRLVDVMNFYGSQIHIDGYAGPTPGAYVSTHGIEMITNPTNAQAVDVDFDKLHVFFVQCALDVTDYEGVLVDQANFIAVGTGFRFVATDSNTPLATFTNSQCAFINKAIDWRRVHQGVVSDANMYLHVNGANPQGTAVYLEDVNASRVTGCTFLGNGVPGGLQTGVSLAGTSTDNVIEACTFYDTVVTPVNLGASTLGNKVHNLKLRGGAAQVVINAAGTANQVEGEATPAHLRYAAAGAKGETIDRRTVAGPALPTVASGTMRMSAVWLAKGAVITNVTYVSSTAAAGLTRRWFALFDLSRNLLRTTADNTATWVAGTALALPLSSTYTVPADGIYYVGICEVATTPTALKGIASTSSVMVTNPTLNGDGSAGLTNAASTPTPGPALTVSSNLPYAYVS